MRGGNVVHSPSQRWAPSGGLGIGSSAIRVVLQSVVLLSNALFEHPQLDTVLAPAIQRLLTVLRATQRRPPVF